MSSLRLTLVVSFFVGSISVAGCTQGEDRLSEDQFCQELARRECEAVAMFCGPSAACERVRTTVCRTFAAMSKTGGRQYSPGSTERCLATVSEAYRSIPVSARTLQDLENVCARAFAGMLRANDPCDSDYQCGGDMVCDKGRCGTAKVVASGAGCANIGERCPRGEDCRGMDGFLTCLPRQAIGQVCSEALPCEERYRCMGTCLDRLPIGMACSQDDDCDSGYCNPFGPRLCTLGLTFSPGSPSCTAYAPSDESSGSDGGAGASEVGQGPASDAGVDAGGADAPSTDTL